jgi:aminoglycoside phosphotransferase (APT) family kinase protein
VSAPPDLERIRDALRVTGPLECRPMPGGASRDLWAVVHEGRPRWVLRRDPPGERAQTSREAEYRVQEAAYAAGVPVPRPVAFGDFGTPGMLMEWVDGEAIARKLLRDPALTGAVAGLADELAAALAALATVDATPFGAPPGDPVDAVRTMLDEAQAAQPALELGLRWLERHRPAPVEPRVVHGDFRLGNFLLTQDGLAAVIDWEFWHLGDPAEDVAWATARPWRFGGDDALAGLRAGVDPDRLRWWDVLSQTKWGAYCANQAALRRAGAHASLERTVLARRVAEAEWDLLELVA